VKDCTAISVLPLGVDGLLRVGEIGRPRSDDDVVDERRWGAERERADERSRARVVDRGGARPRAGDEEAVVAVELDSGCGSPRGSGHEYRAVSGEEAAAVDGAVRDGADVEGRSPADLDALGPEARRKLDHRREERLLLHCGRRPADEHGADRCQRRHGRGDAKHACPPVVRVSGPKIRPDVRLGFAGAAR
jgi:hypothetical protein